MSHKVKYSYKKHIFLVMRSQLCYRLFTTNKTSQPCPHLLYEQTEALGRWVRWPSLHCEGDLKLSSLVQWSCSFERTCGPDDINLTFSGQLLRQKHWKVWPQVLGGCGLWTEATAPWSRTELLSLHPHNWLQFPLLKRNCRNLTKPTWGSNPPSPPPKEANQPTPRTN